MRKDNLIIYFRSTLTSSLVILFSFTIFLTWISEPGFLKPKDVLAQECYQVCNQCDPQGCYCTIICPGFPPAPPPECRSGGCCELGVRIILSVAQGTGSMMGRKQLFIFQ